LQGDLRARGPLRGMPPPRGMLRLAQIKLNSYHPKFLTDAGNDVLSTAKHMNIATSGLIPLPTKKHKFSLLKSAFVHKGAWRQFQNDEHKRVLELYGASAVGQDATNVVHFLRYFEHTIMQLHPGCSARVMLFADEALEAAEGARAQFPPIQPIEPIDVQR